MTPSTETPQRRTYIGQAVRGAAMPLGGIGTGSVALCGDGSLRQWQIFNQVNHEAFLPHSFFAIYTKPAGPRARGEPVAKVIQSDDLYYDQNFQPAPSVSDHIVPEEARRLLERLPSVEATEFVGEYPIAQVRYLDEKPRAGTVLPVEVELEAYSPFIPLNPRDSGLPAVIFTFTVKNTSQQMLDASLLATLQNGVGWDGLTPIAGVECPCYGGNHNSVVRLRGLTAIDMGTTSLPEDDAHCGRMTLATLNSEVTYLCQWDSLDGLWRDFATDGRLPNGEDYTLSAPGRTWNGALAVSARLLPQEEAHITFLLTWYFPNSYVNWDQSGLGIEDRKSKFWLGNRYNRWFDSSLAVAEYLRDNLDRLQEETHRFRKTFYDSTLPYYLLDAISSQVSTIRTPTCLWVEDGKFYGFEGCCGASTTHCSLSGCCPLNCTHVWNYEMALSRLFPSLERTMRETDLEVQQHPSGYIPHRTVVPLYLPRVWDRQIGGPANPALDGELGTVLKAYREYRTCGDANWLGRMWPHLELLMDYILEEHDPDGDGVIEGEQPNTYDISIYGANTFIGTLFLAALRAAEEMARLQGEEETAQRYHERYEKGRERLDTRLWNGEYFIQDVDLEKYPEQNWGLGCHSDQLLGQWWAHLLDLGHLLPEEHVRSATQAIFRHNLREGFQGHVQRPRAFVCDDEEGLLNCSWPRGGRPQVPTLYSDEVWTGIEYEVAGLLLLEGFVEEALHIVKAVRERQNGTRRSPWNEVECGDHYVRAMSSWALLEAASGYRYNAGRGFLAFSPRLTPEDFRCFFITAKGWGTFAQQIADGRQVETLELTWGELELKELAFAFDMRMGRTPAEVTATAGGQMVKVEWRHEKGQMHISLVEPMTLVADEVLRVAIASGGR